METKVPYKESDKRISSVIKAFIIVIACTMQFGTILQKSMYESWLSYTLARIEQSFFNYNFWYYIAVPVVCIFILYIESKRESKVIKTSKLSLFFAI